MQKNVFDFIKTEETSFETHGITVVDGYEWSMYDHIRTTILYKHSQIKTGDVDNKPVKNIILPILRLQYRTEGFDVKDIVLFVNEASKYFMSFLVKKFHEMWARKNDLDTFIDETVESYVDFGGALSKDVNKIKPDNVPLQRIAFCDQTDMLAGPMCEKHFYAPDELKDMEAQGWGDKNKGATITVDELITLSRNSKEETTATGGQSKTPGKHIKVYELHGMFPKWWLTDAKEAPPDEDAEGNTFSRQLHIVAFYQKKETHTEEGVTLYKGKERESPYKRVLRDGIYGRALGLGGAEELFNSQVWTTYSQIHKKNMLDAASKVILKTTDSTVAAKHPSGLKDMDNLEIVEYAENSSLDQLNTTPVNLELFTQAENEWEAHAQQLGAANDSIMGKAPAAGTSGKLQELVTVESQGLHEYRQGKLATYMAEIYRDWIIPHAATEISKGQTFLAELDLDELQAVADSLVTCQANDMIKEKILNGQTIDPNEVDAFKAQVRDQFMKGGNKKFIEILNGEMENAPIDVAMDIAGKQKNLPAMVEKLSKVFGQIIANPAILDDPRMAKIFNQMLEAMGLSPIDFYQRPQPQQSGGPATKVSESINYKDLPPEGQVQMAGQAGIKINPPTPVNPAAAKQPVAVK